MGAAGQEPLVGALAALALGGDRQRFPVRQRQADLVPTPPACRFVADEDGGNTAFFVGGQYKFNPQWGVVAEASFSSHDNRVFVGPRISF
jgi:hypothetical protein